MFVTSRLRKYEWHSHVSPAASKVNMVLNVHRNHQAYWGRGEGVVKWVWRWWKREIIYIVSLHCHHQNDSCIKMGSDESHFNVSLIEGQWQGSVHKPQHFEERRQPKRNWAEAPSEDIVQELCESGGGRPGLSVLTSLLVSVDVKLYWTTLTNWSQLVPNMSTDIRGH